jgi:hypothetical protein
MNIATSDAQALFTKKLIDVYKEKNTPTGFLRSFFPTVESPALEVSIEVQRGTEKVAVDVVRGTDGNRNSFTRSTEKIFIPPYYREYLDVTQLQLYDRLFGATEINDAVFAAVINDGAEKLVEIKNKIERAYEVQCAQVLQTGVVSLISQASIDYKRKAASLVANSAGNTFATGTNDPFAIIGTGCTFLRTIGKASGGVFNLILGATAITDLFGNAIFKTRQNLFNMQLDMVTSPLMDGNGAAYHGTITCGPYRVHLWSYPQYYDVVAGSTVTNTPYIDDKKIVLLPLKPQFKLAFGAVPQLRKPNTPPTMGAYVFSEKQDDWDAVHLMDVKSAGLAVPVAIDQIWTATVCA